MRLALVISFSLIVSSASAQVSGHTLHEWCAAKHPLALGYISGTIDAINLNHSIYKSGSMFCIPAGVSGAQLEDIVCGHLRNKPEERHWGGAVNVFNAVNGAFQCTNYPTEQ